MPSRLLRALSCHYGTSLPDNRPKTERGPRGRRSRWRLSARVQRPFCNRLSFAVFLPGHPVRLRAINGDGYLGSSSMDLVKSAMARSYSFRIEKMLPRSR
jgi:hypothetical protein